MLQTRATPGRTEFQVDDGQGGVRIEHSDRDFLVSAGKSPTEPGDRGGAERRWRFLWELAGIVGVEPGRLTLRELLWMLDGRKREAWNHTAQLLAMVYNAHRDGKTRAVKPAEFHPMAGRRTELPKIKDLSILKQVFVDG